VNGSDLERLPLGLYAVTHRVSNPPYVVNYQPMRLGLHLALHEAIAMLLISLCLMPPPLR